MSSHGAGSGWELRLRKQGGARFLVTLDGRHQARCRDFRDARDAAARPGLSAIVTCSLRIKYQRHFNQAPPHLEQQLSTIVTTILKRNELRVGSPKYRAFLSFGWRDVMGCGAVFGREPIAFLPFLKPTRLDVGLVGQVKGYFFLRQPIRFLMFKWKQKEQPPKIHIFISRGSGINLVHWKPADQMAHPFNQILVWVRDPRSRLPATEKPIQPTGVGGKRSNEKLPMVIAGMLMRPDVWKFACPMQRCLPGASAERDPIGGNT